MREIAIGLVVTAALIGPPALAADMATKAPPVTPAVSTAASQNWYGFYIGAQAGYGWGVDPIDFALAPPMPSFRGRNPATLARSGSARRAGRHSVGIELAVRPLCTGNGIRFLVQRCQGISVILSSTWPRDKHCRVAEDDLVQHDALARWLYGHRQSPDLRHRRSCRWPRRS